MIEFTENGINTVRSYVAKAALRHGFAAEAKEFLKGTNMSALNIRANMFLVLGINCTGQTVSMQNIWQFIRKGTNRFFLSLKNRWELSEDMFKQDMYKGKYNLSCDYYVGPAVFDVSTIGDDVLNEWNRMMEPIRIKGRHGVKVVRVELEEGDHTDIKYRWINRTIPSRPKKSKTK